MGRSMEASDAHRQVATASFPPEEVSSRCRKIQQQQQQQQLAKSESEQSLKCPRCQSTNTKFCYYNNYSLSQPRYFCKGCRRYWTKGGSLRNVPVGGGYRKSKKPPSSSYSSNSKRTSSLPLPSITNSSPPPPPPPPLFTYDPADLNLALASLHKQQRPDYQENNFLLGYPNPDLSCNQGFLDIFRSGFLDDNILCGYGEEGPLVLPSTPTTATTVTTSPQMESCKDSDGEEDKMSTVDLQWQDDSNRGDCNLASSSAGSSTRDQHWPTNGVSSTWHGLIKFSSTNSNR